MNSVIVTKNSACRELWVVRTEVPFRLIRGDGRLLVITRMELQEGYIIYN